MGGRVGVVWGKESDMQRVVLTLLVNDILDQTDRTLRVCLLCLYRLSMECSWWLIVDNSLKETNEIAVPVPATLGIECDI